MTTLNPYIKEYKKNQVETATPEQILIMLYDAAINFLNKAKVDSEQKNFPQFNKNISACKNILLEFMNSLDMEKGGHVAQTLYNLYRYYNKILTKVEISHNLDGVDEVLTHLTGLRETWLKAIEISNVEKEARLIDKYVPSTDTSADKDDADDDNDDDDEEYDDETDDDDEEDEDD